MAERVDRTHERVAPLLVQTSAFNRSPPLPGKVLYEFLKIISIKIKLLNIN